MNLNLIFSVSLCRIFSRVKIRSNRKQQQTNHWHGTGLRLQFLWASTTIDLTYSHIKIHSMWNRCHNHVRIPSTSKKMENLYTFGRETYIPADELQRTYLHFVKNILIIVVTAVKCTVLGTFITIVSLLQFILPCRSKDIKNQVALVRYSNGALY